MLVAKLRSLKGKKIWDLAQIWGKGERGREGDKDAASTAIKALIVQLDSGRSCLNLVD